MTKVGKNEICNSQNPVIKTLCNAREEGFWSLIDRIVPSWLPSIHVRLPSGFNSMGKILAWVERHNQYDVYSFDVFDTLLRRRIAPPELVKTLAAEYLSTRLAQHEINIGQVEILAQRKRCEELLLPEALKKGKDPDYSLDDVMTETLKAIKAEHVLGSEQIVNYEIGLEKKAAQPMPGALEVLSYLKSIGKRVICISDSYLSANQMSSILEYHGFLQYIDKLYVSSDVGKRKSTGRLFQYVIEKEDKKIVHIGDNYDSDYIMPKSLGIKALWFHSRSEQRRKSKLKTLVHSKNKMDYVNAVIKSSHKDKGGLNRVGYEVFGPALTVFVHSVAEQARKDGIEALFFIARDGYVMKKIYETLQHGIYGDSSLPPGKYFCLGRLPVRTASLHNLTYSNVLGLGTYFMGAGKKEISLGDILSSYGLEPSDFTEIAKRYRIDMDEVKNSSDMVNDTRLSKLIESNEFQKNVREKSDQVKRLLREYLVNIGFMGKRNVAVIDANAEGITQSLLDQIFTNDRDYPTVSRYYFNALNLDRNRTDTELDSPLVKGIVSDWRRGSENERKSSLLLGMLIELFAHPNHGVTVGYKNANGKIMPVFRKTPQESEYPLTSQGLNGVLSYAHDYGIYYGLHNYRCEQLLEDMKGDIKQWVVHPPKRDAKVLKDFFLTSDWPIQSNHRLIEQIKGCDIVTIIGLRRKVMSSWWPEATLRLAPMPVLSRLLYRMSTFVDRGLRLLSHLT
jgi:HAD superfamily hydrolase (TIGR01549 family)